MKAAIAILSDFPIQNTVRSMVYQINQLARVDFFGSLLPAHVSLKQPFNFENLDKLERWFDSFCQQIAPFQVDLENLYYAEWSEYAIVGLNVKETALLRALHNQINEELIDVVHNCAAPHDGAEYQFHLTVELGKITSANPFKQFYKSQAETQVKLSFLAEHLALFFYADGPIESGTFICYKVLPLTGKNISVFE